MTTPKAPKGPAAPKGLAVAGKALWSDLTRSFEFEAHELAVVATACRQADVVAALEDVVAAEGYMTTGSTGQPRTHPALAEARQGRLALARLLGGLSLPTEDDERPMTSAQRRAQHAARARWARTRRPGQ